MFVSQISFQLAQRRRNPARRQWAIFNGPNQLNLTPKSQNYIKTTSKKAFFISTFGIMVYNGTKKFAKIHN